MAGARDDEPIVAPRVVGRPRAPAAPPGGVERRVADRAPDLARTRRRDDPAAEAALLLLRVGFALLFVAAPLAGLASRRAAAVLVPTGALVVMAASALLVEAPRPFRALARALTGPVGLAAAFLLAWAGLSLAWTPYPDEAADRLAKVAGTLALAAGAALALPERARASNLYLLALGAGLAAVGALLAEARGGFNAPAAEFDAEGATVERALVAVVLLAWPAAAWLVIAARGAAAAALAAAVALAVLASRSPLLLAGLGAGALVLAAAWRRPRRAGRALAIGLAALLIGAPLLPVLAAPLAPLLGDLGEPLRAWSDAVLRRPLRLVTGHGLEAALRDRFAGRLSPATPAGLLFELWYELGVLGALAAAAAVGFAVERLARMGKPFAPFALAAAASAFAFAALGLGAAQTWWVTALGLAGIALTAVAHGRLRARRPSARGAWGRG